MKNPRPETASAYVKRKGLKSLEEMSQLTGKARTTLLDWYTSNLATFDVLLVGALTIKQRPHGIWLPPSTLIASHYQGAAVIKLLKNGNNYAVRVVEGGFFHYSKGHEIPRDTIASVMAYDEDLGRG